MTTPYVDEDEGIALRLVGIIVVLVVALAIGIGVFKARPAKTAPVPAPVTTVITDEGAAIVSENGVIKFFFATGSAELAGGANEALAELSKSLADGGMLVVSGYHDASGDAALNAELAKQRAIAVRDVLLSLGVAETRIELSRPALSTGTGSPREARRVEVLLR